MPLEHLERHVLIYKKFNQAILFFAAIVIFSLTFWVAHLHEYITLSNAMLGFFIKIAIVAGSYLTAAIVVRLTVNGVTSIFLHGDLEHKLLMRKVYTSSLYLLASIFVLWQLGVTVQNITLFVGLIATGIAFAIRDILVSYLVWFILLTKKPFHIGDYIRIGDERGIVQHIGTMFVLIDDSPETFDEYVRIPNKIFLEKPVHNYGKGKLPFTTRVLLDKVPPDYDAKIQRAEKALRKAVGQHIIPHLDTEHGKVYVVIEYQCAHAQRTDMRDTVLRILLKEFSSKK